MTVVTQTGPAEEQAEEKPGRSRLFTLDDVQYEVPLLSTLDLDEERILFLFADTVIEDFVPAHPAWDEAFTRNFNRIQAGRIRNPAFKRAMAHVAYRRAHPEKDAKTIDAAVGKVNALELDLAILWGDDDPPVKSSQKPLESRSDTKPLSRSTDSGSPTENGSDPAAETHEATGTTESDTSSPGAAPAASES